MDSSDEVQVNLITEVLSQALPEIKSHYTWVKLLRITARIKRFITNTRGLMINNIPHTFLTCEELEWSQRQWWKLVQASCFSVDLSNLTKKIPNKNGRLHNMSLVLDDNHIMRVSSRIINMEEITVIEKEPIILDGNHPYTHKMIMHVHKNNAHQGTETVINEIKRKFWIPHIRTIVKKVIRECAYCRRMKANPPQPKMGLLPPERP
ncbi:hypothetical protein JTB14_013719 [Gonioctena quinquepunctata]|nr:hypothetical protein JTB14_013719 [Gonioctena quinquepunctata]